MSTTGPDLAGAQPNSSQSLQNDVNNHSGNSITLEKRGSKRNGTLTSSQLFTRPRYANSFWLPDYKLGIDRLCEQQILSLTQLHELRKLVFGHIRIHHRNGEELEKLAATLLPADSSFRAPRQMRSLSERRNILGSNQTEPASLMLLYWKHVDQMKEDARVQRETAAEIDRKVLDPLTSFIKLHEPQIGATIQRFQDLLGDYMDAYDEVDRIKEQFDASSATREFVEPELEKVVEPESQPEPASFLTFPLDLGVLKVQGPEAFQEFFLPLIDSVSVTRRRIPLPGRTNETFSSDQLCERLSKRKALGFNPTRKNLETLGQTLLDHGIIVDTGFFPRKFTKEGMWLEWSLPAVHAARGTTPTVEPKTKPIEISSSGFSSMLNTVRTSLMKPKTGINPLELEEKYNESYEELQRVRHSLDMEIVHKAQAFERFQKLRIEITYHSITRLAEIRAAKSEAGANEQKAHALNLAQKYNHPDNYVADFELLLESDSAGIYFPLVVSPKLLSQRHVSTAQLNTNFQNIRIGFNLFTDIPLQVPVDSELVSLRSMPMFLHKIVTILESMSPVDLKKWWLAPLRFDDYWMLKSDILAMVQRADDPNSKELINSTCEILQARGAERVTNFLRNWLLEINDSVIPSTVYDLILRSNNDFIKHMGTIPRSNLSSLVCILEHISRAFNLGLLKGYGVSDDALEVGNSEPEIKEAVKSLNLMDAITSVPFMHLILRPSVVKNASGFKPPLVEYSALLEKLLSGEVRTALFKLLIQHEQSFDERQRLKEQNLGILKRAPSSPPPAKVEIQALTPTRAPVPKQAHAQANQKGSRPPSADFSLRPFRTGTTPRPSPSPSPVHRTDPERRELVHLQPLQLE